MKKLIGIGSLAQTALLMAAARIDSPVIVVTGNNADIEVDRLIITDEAVNIEPRKLDAFMNDPFGLETAIRGYGVSLNDYDEPFRRREPVPVYKRGDTRQLVFGQIVEQSGPVIDTSRVTKRSKRRNRHK